MQAFIVNRIAPTNVNKIRNEKGDLLKKKFSAKELATLTEEERRRYDNSIYGDTIDERLQEFFNKHQDVNHQSGNTQISGVARP